MVKLLYAEQDKLSTHLRWPCEPNSRLLRLGGLIWVLEVYPGLTMARVTILNHPRDFGGTRVTKQD